MVNKYYYYHSASYRRIGKSYVGCHFNCRNLTEGLLEVAGNYAKKLPYLKNRTR